MDVFPSIHNFLVSDFKPWNLVAKERWRVMSSMSWTRVFHGGSRRRSLTHIGATQLLPLPPRHLQAILAPPQSRSRHATWVKISWDCCLRKRSPSVPGWMTQSHKVLFREEHVINAVELELERTPSTWISVQLLFNAVVSWNPSNVSEEFGIISEVCTMSSPIWSTWTRTFTWVVNTKTWMTGAIPSTIPKPCLGISFRMTEPAQDIFAPQWTRDQYGVSTTGPWLIATGHLAKMWRWATLYTYEFHWVHSTAGPIDEILSGGLGGVFNRSLNPTAFVRGQICRIVNWPEQEYKMFNTTWRESVRDSMVYVGSTTGTSYDNIPTPLTWLFGGGPYYM